MQDLIPQITQEELIRAIKPLENPRLWGEVIAYRTRCLRVLRARIFQLLEDPSMNRRRLKAEIDAIVKEMETHGC